MAVSSDPERITNNSFCQWLRPMVTTILKSLNTRYKYNDNFNNLVFVWLHFQNLTNIAAIFSAVDLHSLSVCHSKVLC